jgi:hypothetical protein
MILGSIFAGERYVSPELRRNFSSKSTTAFNGFVVLYRIIRTGSNYGLGYFEKALNSHLDKSGANVPMLMQFGRGDAGTEYRYTVGEIMSVTQYAMLLDNDGNMLEYQSRHGSLELMVGPDDILVSNQIATASSLDTASNVKVSGSMCIVERAVSVTKDGLDYWTVSVHSIEEFGAKEVDNEFLSYLVKEIPKRGEIMTMDGFRVTNKNSMFRGLGCFFQIEEKGTTKCLNGFYPGRLSVNHYLTTTDKLHPGWVENNTTAFAHINRISVELGAAVLSFERSRSEEIKLLQKVPIKEITFIDDFVYKVELDLSKFKDNQSRLAAICQMKGRARIYIERMDQNKVLEDSIMECSIEKKTFKFKMVESFEVKHFLEASNLPQFNLDAQPEGGEAAGEGLNLQSLEQAIQEVNKSMDKDWSRKFIESLAGKKLWIKTDDFHLGLKRAHNMLRLLKQPWNINTPHGRVLSLFNGQVVGEDPAINWEEMKRLAKSNSEVAEITAAQAKTNGMHKKIMSTTKLDAQQKEAATNFLTKGASVTVMEAFGGSGKTYTIGNIAAAFTMMRSSKEFLLITSKTNESVRVLAQELARNETINPDNVLIIQSAQEAHVPMPGRAHQFTMQYKAEKIQLEDTNAQQVEQKIPHDEIELLFKYCAITDRGIQLGKDQAKVRRIVCKHMPPSVIVCSSDMAFTVTGVLEMITHWINDEASISEDVKGRALTAVLKHLKHVLISGDPGQLEPFTNIRVEHDLIRFGMSSTIEQLILRETTKVITLKVNRRSIPALLPAIKSTYNRYASMEAGRIDPEWDTDKYQNFPPGPCHKSPFTLIDISGMHEKIPTGSLRNRFQEDFVTRYLSIIERLEKIKAIPKKSVLVLGFYGGADMAMREILINNPMGKRLEINTVDSSMGKQADTVIVTTSRAEAANVQGLAEDRMFIQKDGRGRVAFGRPRDRMVFIGRMDVCTAQSGAMRNYLRVAAQTTPVMEGEVFLKMLENWLTDIETKSSEGIPLSDIVSARAARYEQSLVLRHDMVNASDETILNIPHISKCRLNKEFGWDNLATHVPQSQLPKDYQYVAETVNYDADLPDISEEKEHLKRILAEEHQRERTENPDAPAMDKAVDEGMEETQPNLGDEPMAVDETHAAEDFADFDFTAPREGEAKDGDDDSYEDIE